MILPITALALNIKRLTSPSFISVLLVADFSDDRVLVGVAEHVFVGKVQKRSRGKADVDLPATEFLINVVENLKGETPRTVTLNQLPDSDTIRMEPNGKFIHPNPLQVGSTYIFSTKYDEKKDHQNLLVAPNAHALVSDDASLDINELKEVLKSNFRYAELKESIKNQITLAEYNAALDREWEEGVKNEEGEVE